MRTVRPILPAAALLAATACARPAECRDAPCGTAVVVASADADALLPVLTQASVGTAVSDLIFLKLADIGPDLGTTGDGGFVPRLARSWTIDDSLTITFHLDPRARWHDGRPVTADDVAFTFAAYQDTLLASGSRTATARIASVTARDSATAVFRFRTAYPEQFYDATYHMRILPRHVLDTIPRQAWRGHPLTRRPLGNGPYRLVRWTAGESIELAADTAFFLGRPGLGRLIWRVAPDFGAAITQVVAGEADIMEFLGGPENIARVRATPSLRAVPYPSPAYVYLGFNFRDPRDPSRPHPLFADRELRRALSMAVDRGSLVRAVTGPDGEVALGPLSRMLWIWSDSIPQLPFDTARARATLDSLGWRDRDRDGVRDRAGRRLEFELLVPTSSQLRRRAAVVLQEQLKQVGVRLRIAELELNVWLDRSRRGRGDATLGSWSQDPTPASLLQTWTGSGIGGLNWGAYRNPLVDRLVDEAMHAADRATALARWHGALAELSADAPAVWLYVPPQVAAVHRRFENVTIQPNQWAATLWTWRVPPDQMIPRDRVAGR